MRILTAFGLLFAFIVMLVAVPEVSALQDVGEGLTGDIALFFSSLTGLWVFALAILGLGTTVMFLKMVLLR